MATPTPPPPAENVNVLDFWAIYSDAPNAFYKSFADEAFARLGERAEAVARLTSAADWERYRGELRRKLNDVVGPFPARTPLHARVTGTVRKPGFRLEKIIFESQPGFHVTAGLFVPDSLQGRGPAIVYCSGHTDAGIRGPAYITMISNLVKKGFIVLAFDPLGQGERLQYLNTKTGLSDFGAGSSTREHSRAGTQCFITGSSLARYMIWDGIRSVDYLLSRPEVDPARIGITGRSGGGTQSAYIAAFDERIHVAAPENYLTTFDQLIRSRGPQDAEQNFLRGIASGIDQTDLLLVRAPKPALIIATTRDIFSIEGANTVMAEARRAYTALGRPGDIAMTVDDAEHMSTKKNREATYAFFRQHLNHPGDNSDEPAVPFTPEELRITETGQVASSLGGETVFTLNRREAEALAAKLEERRRDPKAHLGVVRNEARRLSGYAGPDTRAQSVVFSGRLQRDGYIVEKYLLPVNERYAVPVLAFVPEGTPGRVVVYVHPNGKSAQASRGGEIETLLRQGCAVVAPDLPGTGELGPGIINNAGDGPPRLWYGYVLLGKSMLGRQAQDLARVARFAESRFRVERGGLFAVARGAMGPLLLHATALGDEFARVATIDAPLTYSGLVTVPKYATQFVAGAVPAALTAYDLSDLAACVAPRRLTFIGPRDGTDSVADTATVDRETAVIARAYGDAGSRDQFKVQRVSDRDSVATALAEWLR